jgi:signal peptidase II
MTLGQDSPAAPHGGDERPHRPAARKGRAGRATALLTAGLVAAALIAADRLTKHLAASSLTEGLPVDFLPPLLDLSLTYNTGAAFGILKGATAFNLAIAAIACVSIAAYLLTRRRHRLWELLSLPLVFAGAAGNAIDRLATGRVVDFLHTMFMDFPIFNVADCCITVGAAILILGIIFAGAMPRRGAIGNADWQLANSGMDDAAAMDRPGEDSGQAESGGQ